jgi:folate-binding protein YgfZ
MFILKNSIEIYKNIFPNIRIEKDNSIITFTTEKEEALCFYESACVYDASHWALFRLSGKDVLDFFNRISTNQMNSLQNYSLTSTLLLTEKGRIIDKVKLVHLKDDFILIGSPKNAERIFRWIERYVIMDDVQIEDVSQRYIYLKMLGRKVESFTSLLFNDQIQNAQLNKVYRYLSQNFTAYIYKTNIFKNHIGYEIISEKETIDEFLTYVHSNLEMFDTKFIGEKAFEIIRIEQGEPKYPNELNDTVNPHEADLMKDINTTKGCYIGQEVIARLETYDKVQKNLIGFSISNEVIPKVSKIYFHAGEIGEMTSTVYSYKFKKQIGLGFVSRKVKPSGNGDNFQIKNENDKLINIDLHELPFVKL